MIVYRIGNQANIYEQIQSPPFIILIRFDFGIETAIA